MGPVSASLTSMPIDSARERDEGGWVQMSCSQGESGAARTAKHEEQEGRTERR